jgi:outer membrane receptor protein involved in Fe transport
MKVSCAALALVASLYAADPGTIHLTVKDPSGAPMSVNGTLASAGVSRTFQTDAQGVADIGDLPFGRYRLSLSKAGFTTQALSVDVMGSVTRNVRMAIEGTAYKIDVVATTPLAGVDLARDQIPSPVQAASAADIENSGALDLSDFLNRRLNGVYVNELQSNPFQPDVNYRGYTASPLLGTPQGLSVYMDGVRLNQAFGDVVSWDLIARSAISEMTLMPGSNPLFGLNTLGGALAITTKDGVRNGGTSVQAVGGQYGRRAVEFEHGGANAKGLNWFVTGNLFHEDGWRQASPTDVRQMFSKLGYQRGRTTMALSFSYADNFLTGNGLQEKRFLDQNYSSVYTIPDQTTNHAPFLNYTATHAVNSAWTVTGNAYWRSVRADTFNADLNDDSFDQSIYQPSAAEIAALTAAGYTGFPRSGANASNTPFPSWRCIGQALLKDEPSEKCDGLLTNTYARQKNYGVGGQVTRFSGPAGRRNQLTFGAGYDGRRSVFQQAQQFAFMNPDRTFTAVNAFADGTTNQDGAPVDTRVNLNGRSNTGSVFATDTLSIGRWNLTVSGRFNGSTLANDDNITPAGSPGTLTSRNTFSRFDPAAGLTYAAGGGTNLYFSYSEGSRAPTSIELGCADPLQPCKLPNSMAGDPPLKQVVTRTLEAGVRGKTEGGLDWSAGWFRARNSNDILFVSSTQTGYGYFKNFGETLRQGAQFDADWKWRWLTLGVDYTFLAATYQSRETFDGSNNSTNDAGVPGLDGVIQVQPGNRIPLVPRHTGKAYLDLRPTKKLTINAGLVAASSSFVRGNENNLDRQDSKYYIGPPTSPGYAVVNVGGRYRLTRHVLLLAEISNLADRHYYTGGQIGSTPFTAQQTILARPFPAVNGEYPIVHDTFYAPGAPRTVWGGVRVSF